MAKKIEVTLKLNDRDFVTGIKRANRNLDKLQRNLKQTGSTSKTLGGQGGIGGLTTALAAFGAATVATSSQTAQQIKLSQSFGKQINDNVGRLGRYFESVKGTDKSSRELYNSTRRLKTANRELQEGLTDLDRGTKKAGGGFLSSGSKLLKFAGIAAIVAAAVAGITIAFRQLTSSISTAAQFEDIQITLQNITGSAEAGAYALGLVTEEATKLPFAFQDLASATPVLATISNDLGELRRNINLSADIAANFGIPFDQAASSLQRAFSAGAGAADVFREKGVLAAAGFEAGVSYSIEETQKKLLEFGADIEGAAQTLNTTFSGATSQAGDRLTLFNAAIGESTLPVFKATLLELVSAFDQNSESAFALAKNIGENVVSGFQNAVIGGAYLIDIFEALKNAFIEVVTLGGRLDGFYSAVGDGLKSLGMSLGEGLDSVIDFDKAEKARAFFAKVTETAGEIKKATADVKEGAKEVDDSFKIILGSGSEVETVVEDTRTAFQKLKDAMDLSKGTNPEEFEAFMLRLNAIFEKGEIGIDDYINTKRELDELFGENEALNNFIDTLGTAQKALSEDLATAFLEGQNAGDAFKDFFKKMINQIIADIIRLQIIQPILTSIMGAFGISGSFATGGQFIPGKHNGGSMMPNRPAIVGEKGPELFIPAGAGTIVANSHLQGGGGGRPNIIINAIDTASFQQRLAADPEFVYNLTRVGARRTPG